MRDAPATTCYICGSSGRTIHENLRDRLFGVSGQWSIRKCDSINCRLVWLDPKPLESDLHEAYLNYYTHSTQSSASNGNSPASHGRQFARYLEQLWLRLLLLASDRKSIDHMFLDKTTPGRLLELGCGEGKFLSLAQNLGWDVEGQEVDTRAADGARGSGRFKVHAGVVDSLGLPSSSYDAIVMNHVIEHAFDPIALLRECWRLLKVGGVFVATTPNPESYGYQLFGENWLGLDPPRHLYLFPFPALRTVAAKSGFSSYDVWTSAARAGGFLSASLDIKRTGIHRMRGPLGPTQLAAAGWYQLTARMAYSRRDSSGDEIVLRAWK